MCFRTVSNGYPYVDCTNVFPSRWFGVPKFLNTSRLCPDAHHERRMGPSCGIGANRWSNEHMQSVCLTVDSHRLETYDDAFALK